MSASDVTPPSPGEDAHRVRSAPPLTAARRILAQYQRTAAAAGSMRPDASPRTSNRVAADKAKR
jgi:hypothetical protein